MEYEDNLMGESEDESSGDMHGASLNRFSGEESSSKSEPDDYSSAKVEKGDAIKVAVDWVEFEGALENNSPDLKSFLNKVTGDVIRVFESAEGSDLKLRQTEESGDFLFIDPISSREQYRWMEEFIEGVEESTLKDKLNIAIDGKGAFRRFKDVLMSYPAERERWFAKRTGRLHAHMMEWLKLKNVEPTNIAPWESQENEDRSNDERKQRGEADSRAWRDNYSDMRIIAKDLVDIIPPRELPSAVAFLEFLKGRRGFRRPGN